MRSNTFKARKAIIAGTVASLAMSVSFVDVMAVPMNVTASVAAVCLIDGTTDVVFGIITPGTVPNYDASGSVSWRCTTGTPATIAINGGSTGNILGRDMVGVSSSLRYQLYTPTGPLFSEIWGDGVTESTWSVTGSGMGLPAAVVPIDGRVLDADTLAREPGPYSDVVEVTISP